MDQNLGLHPEERCPNFYLPSFYLAPAPKHISPFAIKLI